MHSGLKKCLTTFNATKAPQLTTAEYEVQGSESLADCGAGASSYRCNHVRFITECTQTGLSYSNLSDMNFLLVLLFLSIETRPLNALLTLWIFSFLDAIKVFSRSNNSLCRFVRTSSKACAWS